MTPRPSISFARHAAPKKGSVVLLSAEGGGLSAIAKACDPGNTLERAFAIADFSGKFGATVEVIAPEAPRSTGWWRSASASLRTSRNMTG